jgi:tRNA G18 (ribose-2'-O)-methylase SpoU
MGMPQGEDYWPKMYRTVVAGGRDISKLKAEANACIWFGNEGHGARDLKGLSNFEDISIPMAQSTESLNVAAAAAIFCYEFRRARQQ